MIFHSSIFFCCIAIVIVTPQWQSTDEERGYSSVRLESFGVVYTCIRKVAHVATAVVKEGSVLRGGQGAELGRVLGVCQHVKCPSNPTYGT